MFNFEHSQHSFQSAAPFSHSTETKDDDLYDKTQTKNSDKEKGKKSHNLF